MVEENKEIRKVIDLYFKSYLGADAEGIARAFDEGVDLLSIDQERLDRTPLPDWLKNIRERREKGDIRQAETSIDLLDVTDDAAVAKATIRFDEFTFTDYLSLLKWAGSWRIVGKVYVRNARKA